MTTPRARLRVVRENVQALQRAIAPLGPDAEFAAEFESSKRLWVRQAEDVDTGLATVAAELEGGAAELAEIEDEVEFVRNEWDEAKEAYARFLADTDTADVRQVRIAAIEKHLAAMVLKIGFLTIPARVVAFLARERGGGAIDFQRAFKNELPDPADQRVVLEFLAESPKGFGIVDVKRGLIWKLDDSALRQALLAAAAIFVLGALVAWFSHELADLAGVEATFAPGAKVFWAYIGVGAGVVLHLAVDLYKQQKSDTALSPTAVDDLILWGALNQRQVLWTAFQIWVGTAILVGLGTLDLATAAFAGYSLDSLVDAGLRRFETAATKAAADLTEKVSAAGAAA